VFDNAYNQMQHPGAGIGVNTTPSIACVIPDTIRINIAFTPDLYTYEDLDISSFNPFRAGFMRYHYHRLRRRLLKLRFFGLFQQTLNKVRGIEVHLPDYPPTDLVTESLFGTFQDDSNPGIGMKT